MEHIFILETGATKTKDLFFPKYNKMIVENTSSVPILVCLKNNGNDFSIKNPLHVGYTIEVPLLDFGVAFIEYDNLKIETEIKAVFI